MLICNNVVLSNAETSPKGFCRAFDIINVFDNLELKFTIS